MNEQTELSPEGEAITTDYLKKVIEERNGRIEQLERIVGEGEGNPESVWKMKAVVKRFAEIWNDTLSSDELLLAKLDALLVEAEEALTAAKTITASEGQREAVEAVEKVEKQTE